MPIVRFAHNWNNKLDGKLFTTIRPWNAEKVKYYLDNIGKTFTVILKNRTYGKARLQAVSVESISDVPGLVLSLDTGMTNQEDILKLFRKFGVDIKVVILLFENETKPLQVILEEGQSLGLLEK